MTEFFDEREVVASKAKFNGAMFGVDPSFSNLLYKGKVCIWVVASVTGDVTLKDVDEETVCRVNAQIIDTAIPLKGTMRDQAILYLANGGLEGVIDFSTPTESEIELDRLRRYLDKSWPILDEKPGGKDVVNAVITLLENYNDGVAPFEAATGARSATAEDDSEAPAPGGVVQDQPSEPSAVASVEHEVVELDDDGEVVDEGTVTEVVDNPEDVRFNEPFDQGSWVENPNDTDGDREERDPPPSVDAAFLKAAMLAGDSESFDRGSLKIGHVDDYGVPDGEGGAEDETILGDDHIVLTSVYRPGSGQHQKELAGI